MITRPVALFTAIMAVTACARHHEDDAVVLAPARDTIPVIPARDTLPPVVKGEVREYQGAFSTSYEVSWFQPCGAPRDDSLWWVTLTEDARQQRDSLLRLMLVRPRHGLAVRWRGTVSPKMPAGAGHMGRGSRYMLVTQIISLRALDSDGTGACSPFTRVGVRSPLRRVTRINAGGTDELRRS